MSITIQKISIVDLDTDCIVNAANSGLRAGGGVCGAIFRAAGHEKLQHACNVIGHCDEGSAVITPGFNLKAEYIIHAVGPIWNGGGYGEAKNLRSSYLSSLELAKENGCTSIGFPLISSGIFGYPVDDAWKVAIAACKEFSKSNPNMQIIFAVLSDDMLEKGNKYLNG